ncbi:MULTISPECIES: sensor histidine kinase [Nostocales]|uniref:histidine kinase n=3 Tax=Nostocales TaxID=1161 RepID=A0A0C1RMU9_9CYAN|nr:CHASE3 domain-containing protein [Tolypothrix bouteillei]KAF3887679.1 GAF domain-containing protein [Tolypothrix bouteillei VB521301]
MLQITQVVFRRRLISTIALPIILPLLLSGISIWQITRLLSAMDWVDHTDQVIAQANRTQKLLLDLETGVRGFQTTGEREFLEPYQQARSYINTAFDELTYLVSDNSLQLQRLSQLRSQYTAWFSSISQAIARKERGNVEPLSELRGRKLKMDKMRLYFNEFIATEEQLRDRRAEAVQTTTQRVILSSVVLSVSLGSFLAYYTWRYILSVSQNYESALSTAREQTESAQRSAQRLAALHTIDRAILEAESIESLIRNALIQMHKLIPYEQAFVALFNFEKGTSDILAGIILRQDLEPFNCAPLPLADFGYEPSFYQNPNSIKNLVAHQSCDSILAHLPLGGIHSCLRIPLFVKETLLGELNLAATQTNAFDDEAREIGGEVAAQLAIAIQQSLLRDQLQRYALKLEERVTERTTELQETNQELESFTYSVSHDLRSPLRTMQGFAQALQEDYGDQIDSMGQEYIQFITDGAIHMDTLISDLLAYSRLSRAQIQLQPVELNNVIEEAQKQIATQMAEKKAEITINTSLPSVIAHRSTLIQVVTNLLSNAIKFVKPGVQPKIQISAQEKQNFVELSFADNGIGIAPEYQERVFRVFERLHSTEEYPGTGIGLAIVRKGIERMGGQVVLESKVGAGSRFIITLPKSVTSDRRAV